MVRMTKNMFTSECNSIFIFLVLFLIIDTCNCQNANGKSLQELVRDRYKPDAGYNRQYHDELCPHNFIRLTNKCYYLSDTSETWLNAFYKCKDMKSELATINRAFEDRHLKKLLQQGKNNTRWIGGILNGQTWTWGKTAVSFQYNGFTKLAANITADGKLYCVSMDATKRYRWTPENCFTKNYFICQKLQNRRKIQKPGQIRRPYANTDGLNRRKLKPKKINKNVNKYELNNNVIPDTQNDVAYTGGKQNAYAYNKNPRQMVNLLNRVTRRCRDRDAVVLKHINSTLSEAECIDFFIDRWQRRQRKTRDNRSKESPMGKINTITPKTLIKYRNSELHPARIEESHDVYVH